MKQRTLFTLPVNSTPTILLSVALATLIISGCAGQTDQYTAADNSEKGRLVAMGNGVCKDTRTGRMWQVGTSKNIKSLEDAKSYTGTLKDGGYDDWRLPSVTELYGLYMIFDLHQNGDCELQVEGTYWSDEADLHGRVGTWELDDNCDPERQYIPKKKGKVRAVRS